MASIDENFVVTLDADELASNLILCNVAPTEAHIARAETFLSGIPATTTALRAIAFYLDRCDDTVGGDMVRAFAETFSNHEATTL